MGSAAEPITALDLTGARLVACHDGGTVQRVPPLPAGGVARCTVCGAVVRERSLTGNPGALAWASAALILFAVAQSLPLLAMEIEGRGQSARIVNGVLALWDRGMWPLALVVLIAAILAPLARILLMLAVLVPVERGRAPGRPRRCSPATAARGCGGCGCRCRTVSPAAAAGPRCTSASLRACSGPGRW